MSIINNGLLLASGADAAVGYQISRSLRFNSADSAYLERVASSAGDRAKWTLSFWIKRTKLGTSQDIFSAGTSGTDILYFTSGDALALDRPGATVLTTTQVFRDVSAWYHIVLAVDAANGTNSNKAKLYVNGSEITAYSTDNRSGVGSTSFLTNTATTHRIGVRSSNNTVNPCDMYLADVYLLDGTTTDPSTFAETDAITGQWVPKTPTGISYGTNGFRLTFSDNSGTTSTTLGKDAAGSNNWSCNNFSVASGSGNDSLVDTPTSISATDTGIGGEIRGNYCTWNPLDNAGLTLSNGNLQTDNTVSAYYSCRGTIKLPSTGKWYFETTVGNPVGAAVRLGVGTAGGATEHFVGVDATQLYTIHPGGSRTYSTSITGAGAVLSVAYDADSQKLWFGFNNSWLDGSTGLTGNPAAGTNPTYTSISDVFPTASQYSASNVNANFGQRAFAYTAPSGFKALVDTNLTAPVIAKPDQVMGVKLYTGNGSTQTISGLGFSPDLLWIKSRSDAYDHYVQDAIRGATVTLETNNTGAETTNSDGVTAFTSTGFSVGAGNGYTAANVNNATYVAWAWDAGTSTVTNNNGSISSQVRANASAGFSVVTFNSGGSNGEFSVGHGLGVAPRLIIMKSRTRNGGPWWVHHLSATDTTTKYLQLSTTSAVIDNGGSGSIWGAALPTSTLFGFSVGAGRAHTQNEDIVSYCFAPVAGYSAMGSYTGNGSADGTFIYTGFRPRFILMKDTTVAHNWQMLDSARDSYNVASNRLFPNTSGSEVGSSVCFDFLSNGFKARDQYTTSESGSTYIYFAVAENPFAYARAR